MLFSFFGHGDDGHKERQHTRQQAKCKIEPEKQTRRTRVVQMEASVEGCAYESEMERESGERKR